MSCGPLQNDHHSQLTIDEKVLNDSLDMGPISCKSHSARAILIGNTFNAFDERGNAIHRYKQGEIVDIIGVSDSLYNSSIEYCDGYHWVKVQDNDTVSYIDGRRVYEIIESEQDTFFNYMGVKYWIKTTEFYGVGVADDEGLTGCSNYHQPVVMIDSRSDQPKLIEIIKNDVFEDVHWDVDFEFFDLLANDGAYDEIIKIEETQNGVLLTIRREYQEGTGEYQVRLFVNDSVNKAEYVKHVRHN
jgi:hypothetical protein